MDSNTISVEQQVIANDCLGAITSDCMGLDANNDFADGTVAVARSDSEDVPLCPQNAFGEYGKVRAVSDSIVPVYGWPNEYALDCGITTGTLVPKKAPSMCMTVAGGSMSSGAAVQIYPCNISGVDRTWRFVGPDREDPDYLTDGDYQLRNTKSDLCLAVQGKSLAAAARLVQLPCATAGSESEWSGPMWLRYTSNAYFPLRNRNSGMCIATNGGSIVSSTPRIQYPLWRHRNGRSLELTMRSLEFDLRRRKYTLVQATLAVLVGAALVASAWAAFGVIQYRRCLDAQFAVPGLDGDYDPRIIEGGCLLQGETMTYVILFPPFPGFPVTLWIFASVPFLLTSMAVIAVVQRRLRVAARDREDQANARRIAQARAESSR
ncbi:MAG: ricin-type beta-trefoil lectin domain protein [Pseudonocardia sp.]|nr:ricin-type beta-trefoil lectin domain protein [Pseudonocardia sp.]